MEFQYLFWICPNISENSLKKQLFEILNIHMDKYLLLFKLSFFQLLIKGQPVGGGERERKKSVKSESDEIIVEFPFVLRRGHIISSNISDKIAFKIELQREMNPCLSYTLMKYPQGLK